MNFKNLIMWAIKFTSVGLFNMFQDPKRISAEKMEFLSNFLDEDNGRVVEVPGHNISGILADGKV